MTKLPCVLERISKPVDGLWEPVFSGLIEASHRVLKLVIASFALWVCGGESLMAAANHDLASAEKRIQQVLENVRSSIVGVGLGRSSGAIVSKKGHVLTTAFQLPGDGQPVPVRMADGRILEAKPVEMDLILNIALLNMRTVDASLMKSAPP